MRTSNFGKGLLIEGFFRLCLGIIVSLTLAMGGMALNTQPVRAFDIFPNPLPASYPVNECESLTIQFAHDSAYVQSLTPPRVEFFFIWGFGGLPPDAAWDMNTGVLTVCPRLGSSAGGTPIGSGTYPIAVLATSMDALWKVDVAWWQVTSIQVNPAIGTTPLVITPTIPPVAWEGMPYNTTLTATGCSGIATNYNWAETGLPVGLALDPATGIISGTPAPGTCGGPYIVNVTCIDTSMCTTAGCCLPATATLYFYVDCWANYLALVTAYTTTTSCDFTVNIGPGLETGTTNVVIDGNQEATLTGNGSELFTSVPCESHLVVVDQTVQGPDPKTRYTCIGSNSKMVSDIDNVAYFDYARDVWIDTGSDPAGVAQPPGAGFYAAGAGFISSAPSPVQLSSQPGTKYLFKQWSLPDGSTNPNRDLWFTVTSAGKATALYDTYYELILKSDFPAVLEKSWELAGSNAAWNLALQPIPFPNIFGALGGVYEPTNAQGSHNMTGPYTQEIMWQENWFWPIFWIVVTLLAIAAAVYFILRSRKKQGGDAGAAGGTGALPKPPAGAATTEVKTLPADTAERGLPKAAAVEPVKVMPALSAEPAAKQALPQAESEAEPKDKPNFCPKCGSPVDEGAGFCKKCGKKLG